MSRICGAYDEQAEEYEALQGGWETLGEEGAREYAELKSMLISSALGGAAVGMGYMLAAWSPEVGAWVVSRGAVH